MKYFYGVRDNYVLVLDDLRHPMECITGEMLSRYHSDDHVVLWAKDIDMAKWYVEHYGMPIFMHLDHDIGSRPQTEEERNQPYSWCGRGRMPVTTMDFLRWLEREGYVEKYDPPGFYVHSDNVDGRMNIMSFFQSWAKLHNRG